MVKGMKKKAYELSTLCGLDIGMIICSPSGQIETLSWPNQQDDDGNTLLDLIASYKNQDGNRKKTVNVTRGISKKEKQKAACESELDAKSKLFVSCSSQLGEQSGPSVSRHCELHMKSEKELRESALCLDSKIERIMDPDDLVFLLNQIMDQPVTPIQEDSSTASATFASHNDTSCHSNIPSVMTTGGYPMTSQVMIGRAAFQDFTYNSYLHDAPQYTNDNGDQLSYNPYLWRTPY
ncbi:agamous-like MADS-box protein AGL82 [Tanacetum coccineum]